MQFEFIAGGYMGSSSYFKIKDQVLQCAKSEIDFDPFPKYSKSILVENSPEFKAMMDYLSTRKWKGEYKDELILDGGFWYLTVVTDTFCIKANGANAYPRGFHKFRKLLDTVSQRPPVRIPMPRRIHGDSDRSK